LTRQHTTLIDDFFERGLTEAEVCEKHGLTLEKLREWCQDSDFKDEVQQRLFAPVSQAWIMLARSAPKVARRLIELTDCEKDDTARKACLDILTALPWETEDTGGSQPGAQEHRPHIEMSDEAHLAILKILANEESQHDEERKKREDRMYAAQRQCRAVQEARVMAPDSEKR
jgi:hypothetical protein